MVGVHEQWDWPPASYVAPQCSGLAAQTAYRSPETNSFTDLAELPKTIGWWTVKKNSSRYLSAEASQSDLGGSFFGR